MFRIVCYPSSGSIKLYLTEIRSGSLIKHTTNISEPYEFQLSTVLYTLMMDRIRSETCQSDF